jgi:hypothetical protein
MEKITLLATLFILSFTISGQTKEIYDFDYVSFGNKTFNNETFTVVQLKRKNMRVRAKYFAAELDGKSIGQRYLEWSKNKNIICYSSGAYMSSFDASRADLIGLTIDFGKVVNKTFVRNKLHALVVVYPNGEVDVVNLEEGKVSFEGSGQSKVFNMSNENGVEEFIGWAKSEKLTVFQTHLLTYNNTVGLASNSAPSRQERRFLAITTNKKGEKEHFIINKPDPASLLDATNAVVGYLNSRNYNVEALINLDTGAQDTFRFFDYKGIESDVLKGRLSLKDARNLIVYYYE